MESVVRLAELVKHRVKGLHQITKVTSIAITDEYEPLEEGLDHLSFTRNLPALIITLSLEELDASTLGY